MLEWVVHELHVHVLNMPFAFTRSHVTCDDDVLIVSVLGHLTVGAPDLNQLLLELPTVALLSVRGGDVVRDMCVAFVGAP